MRKFLKSAFVLCSFLTILILSSCGGKNSIDRLCCCDFFYKESINIDFISVQGNTEDKFSTTFISEDNIDIIHKRLWNKKTDYEVDIIRENAIIVEYMSGEKKNIGFIKCVGEVENDDTIRLYSHHYVNKYCFWSFEGKLKKGENTESFVFPYNLIDEVIPTFESGEKYRTKYEKADFIDFYNLFGILDISETEEGFSINGFTGNEEIKRNISFPIEFSFDSDENGNYFIVI